MLQPIAGKRSGIPSACLSALAGAVLLHVLLLAFLWLFEDELVPVRVLTAAEQGPLNIILEIAGAAAPYGSVESAGEAALPLKPLKEELPKENVPEESLPKEKMPNPLPVEVKALPKPVATPIAKPRINSPARPAQTAPSSLATAPVAPDADLAASGSGEGSGLGSAGSGSGRVNSLPARPDADAQQRLAANLQQSVERHKSYPLAARRARQEGTAEVLVIIGADGKIENVRLLRATHTLLGAGALETLERVKSDWSYPEWQGGRIEITLPVYYRLR